MAIEWISQLSWYSINGHQIFLRLHSFMGCQSPQWETVVFNFLKKSVYLQSLSLSRGPWSSSMWNALFLFSSLLVLIVSPERSHCNSVLRSPHMATTLALTDCCAWHSRQTTGQPQSRQTGPHWITTSGFFFLFTPTWTKDFKEPVTLLPSLSPRKRDNYYGLVTRP